MKSDYYIEASRHIIWTLFIVAVVGDHTSGKMGARFISNLNELYASRDVKCLIDE